MRVDLYQLLKDRSVGHPSRITSAVLADNDFVVRVRGWPWWSDNADRDRDHSIELVFGGVGCGAINPSEFDPEWDEALEPFEVIACEDLAWAQPSGSAIYCQAPLPEPLEMYMAVHDLLISYNALRDVWRYFNNPDSRQLDSFVRITRTNSYLLGQFPGKIRNVVCAKLDAQGVPYYERPTGLASTGRYLVTIQNSQFFCETAHAEFES